MFIALCVCAWGGIIGKDKVKNIYFLRIKFIRKYSKLLSLSKAFYSRKYVSNSEMFIIPSLSAQTSMKSQSRTSVKIHDLGIRVNV